MTLEQFAKRAGVTLGSCKTSDGGKICYREVDYPGTVVFGFRTARAAYNHWLENTFGKSAGKAVRSLLKEKK